MWTSTILKNLRGAFALMKSLWYSDRACCLSFLAPPVRATGGADVPLLSEAAAPTAPAAVGSTFGGVAVAATACNPESATQLRRGGGVLQTEWRAGPRRRATGLSGSKGSGLDMDLRGAAGAPSSRTLLCGAGATRGCDGGEGLSAPGVTPGPSTTLARDRRLGGLTAGEGEAGTTGGEAASAGGGCSLGGNGGEVPPPGPVAEGPW